MLIIFNSIRSRYLLFWRVEFTLVRLLCVSGVGLAAFGLFGLAARLSARTRGVLACVGAVAVLANLVWRLLLLELIVTPDFYGKYLALTGLLLIALTLVSIRRRLGPQRWAGWLGRLGLFLCPLVPVYWINLLLSPSYAMPPAPTAAQIREAPATGREPRHDLYLLVFDGWPPGLTFERGRVDPSLPNLARFVQRACVFSDAHAPGCTTMQSLPRMVFETDRTYVLSGGRVGFWDGKKFSPCSGERSVFARAREGGYRTYMIGWHHPYHLMLAGQPMDVVRAVCRLVWYDQSVGGQAAQFLQQCAYSLVTRRAVGWLAGPRPDPWNVTLVRNTRLVEEALHAAAADPRPGQFVVCHHPLPHWPFIYGPEGPGPLDREYDRLSAELLRRQLVYLDQRIGAFLERLEAAGKLDRATVILTADHNWRLDPRIPFGEARQWTHVPLLIKLPGQTRRVDLERPFTTSRVFQLLDAAGGDPARLPALLASRSWYFEVPDEEAYWEWVWPPVR